MAKTLLLKKRKQILTKMEELVSLAQPRSHEGLLVPYGDIKLVYSHDSNDQEFEMRSPLTNNWESFSITKTDLRVKRFPEEVNEFCAYYKMTRLVLNCARAIRPMHMDLRALDPEEIRIFGVKGEDRYSTSLYAEVERRILAEANGFKGEKIQPSLINRLEVAIRQSLSQLRQLRAISIEPGPRFLRVSVETYNKDKFQYDLTIND